MKLLVNFTMVSISIFLVSSLLIPFANGDSFDGTLNLSNSNSMSANSQLSSSGNNLYVIWEEDEDIFFIRSTDNGDSFDGTLNLSNSNSMSANSQLSSSGNNLYVIWEEDEDIFFIRSTDNGDSFDGTLNLSNSNSMSANSQLSSSGNNLYVIWEEDEDIFFIRSTDNGDSFDGTLNLSNSNSMSANSQLSSSGNNLYVIWEEDEDIFFIRSTDNGDSFDGTLNLSNSNNSSIFPQIDSDGSMIHVIWKENLDIFYTKSTDDGTTFQENMDLGNTGDLSQVIPQLSISGTYVYVIWNDSTLGNDEIIFKRSIDEGNSFENDLNLSVNAGSSIFPKIHSSGNNVFIIWQDLTPVNTTFDILLRQSEDNGVTFGNQLNISNNMNSSTLPQIFFNQNQIFTMWQEKIEDSSSTSDIIFRTNKTEGPMIEFDSTRYKFHQSPSVTISDPFSIKNNTLAETITANLKSTSDQSGISLVLSETGLDTNEFVASFVFTDEFSSDGKLHANAGDGITLSFQEQAVSASIFGQFIKFELNEQTDFLLYDYGDIANILVDDNNANVDIFVIDDLSVLVTSGKNPSGIPLILKETGINTGLFGGVSSNLIFLIADSSFPSSGIVTIIQENKNANIDDLQNDSHIFNIFSTSDPSGITLDAIETGINTNVFTAELLLTQEPSVDKTSVRVEEGDFLTIGGINSMNVDTFSNWIINPNPNEFNGAIPVKFPQGDRITVFYNDMSESIDVGDRLPGGGGGSLVRPGFVLDFSLGLLGGGGGGDNTAPILSLDRLLSETVFQIPDDIKEIIENHDPLKPISPLSIDDINFDFDFPFSMNDKIYLLSGYSNTIETHSLSTNDNLIMNFTFFDASKIQHVSIGFIDHSKNIDISNSHSEINYDINDGLHIRDPHDYFKNEIHVVASKVNTKDSISFEIPLKNPMQKSGIVIRAWDINRNSYDTIVYDAIEVVDFSSMLSVNKNFQKTLDANTLAKLSSNNTITSDFELTTSSVSKFKSDRDAILSWAGFSKNVVSDSELLSYLGFEDNTSVKLSNWLKHDMAKWLYKQQITEKDFKLALDYLYSDGQQ